MSDPVPGRPLWHELLTTDMKAAGTFYSAVIIFAIHEPASPPPTPESELNQTR